MRLLILEDDAKTAEYLREEFSRAGFQARVTASGDEALAIASEGQADLLIFDVMVPGKNGFEVVAELRRQKNNTPVLFLSAKRSLESRIEGLEVGGDDYLTKPFSFSELLARCQAILRRSSKAPESHKLSFQGLEIDLLERTVMRGEVAIELQQREFALLEFLMRNQGRVVSKTEILKKIWNYGFDPQTNVVDVLVCRLRNKLERGQSKRFINTIRGVGYILDHG